MVDLRANTKKKSKHGKKYYRGGVKSNEKMKQAVMIVLHQTAGARAKAKTINGRVLNKGKKVEQRGYQYAPVVSQKGLKSAVPGVHTGQQPGNIKVTPDSALKSSVGVHSPVHFWVDLHNSYWEWDLEVGWGGGDQPLNGGNAKYDPRPPAIGIEIMHWAPGVIGAPPASKNAASSNQTAIYSKGMRGKKKWKYQKERALGSLHDGPFARSGQGGYMLPPNQIQALRQTIQFIMAYLREHYGTRIIYIASHRSGYDKKPSCPGDYAIRHGIAPVMEQLGLQPLPAPAPFTLKGGAGKNFIYDGNGMDWPEVYFHDTVWETQWKGKPYFAPLKKLFTRESGWNALNKPLTLDEAKRFAGKRDQRAWPSPKPK